MSRLAWAVRSAASAVRDASASDCRARSVSATFWNPVITAWRYCASACRAAASAARWRRSSVKPSKIGCVTPAVRVKKPLPGTNRPAIWVGLLPISAAILNNGRRFATATPICALAARQVSSAARMSGRCSTSRDGKLTGSSSGSCSDARSNVSVGWLDGNWPVKAASRLRCWASCFSNGGRVAWAVVSKASWTRTSACATCPNSNCLRSRFTDFETTSMICRVASTCARISASCTAAATTLEVRVR